MILSTKNKINTMRKLRYEIESVWKTAREEGTGEDLLQGMHVLLANKHKPQ